MASATAVCQEGEEEERRGEERKTAGLYLEHQVPSSIEAFETYLLGKKSGASDCCSPRGDPVDEDLHTVSAFRG